LRKLILFDIDGTLILSGGAGGRAMNRAFDALCGIRDALHRVDLAGRTDRIIMTDALAPSGRALDEPFVDQFREVYSGFLREELHAEGTGWKGALPGIPALLETLAARPDISLALLTGNFRASAEIKLAHFDLWRYFAWGAFADDAVDRNDLFPVALSRAHADGLTGLHPSRVIIVGDTPHDVTCARSGGGKAVAVATGNYDTTRLRACEPDALFEDLRDPTEFLALLDSWT
jgi:phosphoglycolate phosphatase-like HAD superfamily hydrolase